MQIEVYKMTVENEVLTIALEAICDTFSSLEVWSDKHQTAENTQDTEGIRRTG